MERDVVISAEKLAIGYSLRRGKIKTVNPSLDFEICAGQLTCLMGLNGAGKSTLIKTLCGTIAPLSGKLDISGDIGLVLTERTNAGGLSVYDLVSLGRYKFTGIFGNLNEEDNAAVRNALEAVGISDMADAYISELSDGERQKAFIAKALAQECPIIILDEPTAFLDVRSRREVMNLLQSLAHNNSKTILLSTHDLDLALKYADKLMLLAKKSPIVCGAPSFLQSSGTLNSFFGIFA